MVLTDEILHDHKENVLQLIQLGVDVNQIDIYGFTPLIEAAIADNIDIAALLIAHGAKVNERDLTGGTALHWAVENSNLKLCELLLKHGADPNAYTRDARPILLQPLLRRQQDLKEFLYRHNANLKFAQDYINTKLIGHRFELQGKVDIVDPKEVFIEMSFEGFIPEFTVSVMQDSLAQFKNNFAARNLRSHFPQLQAVIGAFSLASELLRYQQHLVNIDKYKQRLTEIAASDLLLLPVGYAGHAITFVKCGHLFAKCDRGENSLHHPTVEIFRIHKPRQFDAEFLKHLIYKRQSRRFVDEGIIEMLGLEPFATIPLSSQLTGNCSWANTEASVPTMLFMLWLRENPRATEEDVQRYQEIVMAIYKQWLEWDKDWALHQCIESFHEADPARKASKAAILAAVLFQTCRYTVPQDLERANKILAILSTPNYEYVLESYLKVYKKTEAGRNLLELIDLYK